MASINQPRPKSRGKRRERISPRENVSEYGVTFKSHQMGGLDKSIDRLINENRRLKMLAKGLRADIMQLMTWRDMRH